LLRFLADEGFSHAVTRQLRERGVDVVTAQEAGLVGSPDPVILEWAAYHGRIVVTSDVSTMPDHAYARMQADLPMPGLFVAHQGTGIGVIVEELHTIAACSLDREWENQARYIPLR